MREWINGATVIANAVLLLSAPSVSAELTRMHSGGVTFPVAVNFPTKPQELSFPAPAALKKTMYHSFVAVDRGAMATYSVLVVSMDRSLGVASRDVAQQMVDKSVATQTALTDSALGVKSKVIESDKKPLSGYVARNVRLERALPLKLYGRYQAVFVDRFLIVVWASGIDSDEQWLKTESFVNSLKIIQE